MFFMSVSSVGVNREKWEFQEVEKMKEMERMIIKIKKKEGGMKIQKTFPNLFFIHNLILYFLIFIFKKSEERVLLTLDFSQILSTFLPNI